MFSFFTSEFHKVVLGHQLVLSLGTTSFKKIIYGPYVCAKATNPVCFMSNLLFYKHVRDNSIVYTPTALKCHFILDSLMKWNFKAGRGLGKDAFYNQQDGFWKSPISIKLVLRESQTGFRNPNIILCTVPGFVGTVFVYYCTIVSRIVYL